MNDQQNYNQNPNQYAQQPQMNPNQYVQQPQMNPNQYAQQPQMNPNQYVQQPQVNPPHRQQLPVQSDQPEDNHVPNILCIISLVCMFVVPIISFIVLDLMDGSSMSEKLLNLISNVATCIMGTSYLVAWVLMIIVRAKYKKNKFGLILMIIYLIMLALTVIAAIILVASCISCLRDCKGM